MATKQLNSTEEFAEIKEQPYFLLFKHSLTCPVSQAAFDEFNKYMEDAEIPGYYLYVQEARPLSNFLAEETEIKHESPQAFLFKDGQVVWHASHWNITQKSIQKEVEANK